MGLNPVPDSYLTLYADGMLLYRSIADYALLQDDINRISMWVDANCKVMKTTRKRTGICPPTLYITVVSHFVDSYKYLGILLSLDVLDTAH